MEELNSPQAPTSPLTPDTTRVNRDRIDDILWSESAWYAASPTTKKLTCIDIPDTYEVFVNALGVTKLFALKTGDSFYVCKPAVLKCNLNQSDVLLWQGEHPCPQVVQWTFIDTLNVPAMHHVDGVHMLKFMEHYAEHGLFVDERRLCVSMRHLLLGVQFLHGKGCPHGDLAPQNVLCQQDGSVVIVDTDDAMRRFLDKSQYTSGHCTSASIMPPEVAQRYNPSTTTKIEASTDIWALGMLLLLIHQGPHVELQHDASDNSTALVSKNAPFKSTACSNIFFIAGFDESHAPPQVCPPVRPPVRPPTATERRLVDPPWVASLLLLCLQPNPAQRCGSAAALLALLPPDGGGPLRPNLQM